MPGKTEGKKLKAICPHCNRALEIDVDEGIESGGWLICTPLPEDITGPKGSEIKGKG